MITFTYLITFRLLVDNHSDFLCIQLNEGEEIKLITGLFSFQKQSQTAPSIPLKQDRYGLIIYLYIHIVVYYNMEHFMCLILMLLLF